MYPFSTKGESRIFMTLTASALLANGIFSKSQIEDGFSHG
jgi:hypothetical protein